MNEETGERNVDLIIQQKLKLGHDIPERLHDPMFKVSWFYYDAWLKLRTDVAPAHGYCYVPWSSIVRYCEVNYCMHDLSLMCRLVWALDKKQAMIVKEKLKNRENTIETPGNGRSNHTSGHRPFGSATG